jgi:hypothetical protein
MSGLTRDLTEGLMFSEILISAKDVLAVESRRELIRRYLNMKKTHYCK